MSYLGLGAILDYDFENPYGLAAAKRMVELLRQDRPQLMATLPPHNQTGEEQSGLQILYTMGIARKKDGILEVPEKTVEKLQVSKFLNRVLMLDVKTQNALFEAFADEMATAIKSDQELGLFDEGVQDIVGTNVRLAEEAKVVATDQATGARTFYYKINAETPTQPVTLEQLAERNQNGWLDGMARERSLQ